MGCRRAEDQKTGSSIRKYIKRTALIYINFQMPSSSEHKHSKNIAFLQYFRYSYSYKGLICLVHVFCPSAELSRVWGAGQVLSLQGLSREASEGAQPWAVVSRYPALRPSLPAPPFQVLLSFSPPPPLLRTGGVALEKVSPHPKAPLPDA